MSCCNRLLSSCLPQMLPLQCWQPLLQDPEKMKARRDRFGPTPGQAKAEVTLQKLSSWVTCSPWHIRSFGMHRALEVHERQQALKVHERWLNACWAP